ncbi:putative acyl carrier protein, mitochondrial [Schizosaccharomyces pombe]|uniref:Putative acyl carrier protein, mitochondrial n=1 Tax=Schizosaccharomyces pombe (strain 972 / ATCC 24843) TaxID=284812 RepID=ACPM_SCHPO|nr:putative type II fatty acid synthase subunit [Schizosaccharomyces pombe]Q10217.1 RecName: Full=Putative acyl carrier protein, mitochondrial; Short=ACP; Flags: Precursor [Schizosaccharomyces pombe 972h-]CAA93348.1 mitochondrial type II fatty acid synthase component (predicted) [Schizosaccharomyces pombe]|eukprot:NP_594345.1 putative type II fatty acid synthase subunit [Schizosaccharomyces pombe]
MLSRFSSQLRFISAVRPVIPKFQPLRFYSVARPDAEKRILKVVSSFDKIQDPKKVTPTSTFANDLGLDSLDAVEVVMAIEEEFSIQIPDKDADEITSVGDAISYITKNPEAK